MTPDDRFSMKGHLALITGSSRGIGRAMAVGFAGAGAEVIVHGTRAGAALNESLGAVRSCGVRAAAVTADLADHGRTKSLYSDACTALGAPDILVLNASVQIRKPWDEITTEEFAQQINVNLRSSLELIQAAVPAMKANRWGRILTIGSVQQIKPHPAMAVYAASKCALASLVKNLAKQLAPDGITVNNLAPGVIMTDRNTEALSDPKYREKVREMIPARFFGEADDCTGAALLICSDAGRYINGADLLVDGGFGL
jgi:NAD(P)-dependent dehydrogenase (short-subunit alcohol dehydrogenase family)